MKWKFWQKSEQDLRRKEMERYQPLVVDLNPHPYHRDPGGKIELAEVTKTPVVITETETDQNV